ncbi:ABC transporter permease [Lentisphaerota bacterium ZTH]|nr:ABC transporter permease [Lentisphaerota bacterium]WET07331.1 ABC transporter permease [Lentisphaerota bacterium ZTH]
MRQEIQLFQQVGDAACKICTEALNFIKFSGEMLGAFADAVRHPRKIHFKNTLYYMDICGSDAVPIVSLLGTLIGVILAFQAFVQLGRYGVQNYVVNLIGTVIVTELGPLMTAVVLAGRSGSAFAAEIGTMKASEEIDALVTFGMLPSRVLIVPKVLAMIVVLPCLTVLANIFGIIGGMLIVCSLLDLTVTEYYFKVVEVVKPLDLTQGLVKSFFFALIIAAIGCMKGFEADRDAQGVGRAATSSVVTAIFLIIIADAVLTSLFSI